MLQSLTTFNSDDIINGDEFELVNSYFKEVISDQKTAKTFTTILFKISNETKIPAMMLLEQIKGKTNLEMNGTLAYYLNSLQSKTALYGIGIVPQSNQIATRNILV